MSDICQYAINQVNSSADAFCRFITVNDTGENGSHQSGFYIPKCAARLLFDIPGVKGKNKEKFVKILWQNSFTTESRFIYYGQGSRNEYRITRFGRNFEFLNENNVGNLLVICKISDDYYTGIVLERDEDIDDFLAFFNLNPDKTNQLIQKTESFPPDRQLEIEIDTLVSGYSDFPGTEEMAELACMLYNKSCNISEMSIINSPDIILKWIDTEYRIFGKMEERLYKPVYSSAFPDCQALISFSNRILNRRKARAGKSLENHLARIFRINGLKFSCQAVTEDNKKPDFIFPDIMKYRNMIFPAEGLTFLGAKTTCKDRWRQVLNEADRIRHNYLFTLQQGISSNQLKEMKHENLSLVVPEAYKASFDKKYHDNILTLKEFISEVRSKQNKFCI